MKKAQEKKLRAAIMRREGVERVRITRSGDVHAFGWMPRGDGGKRPWWAFVGDAEGLLREIVECER